MIIDFAPLIAIFNAAMDSIHTKLDTLLGRSEAAATADESQSAQLSEVIETQKEQGALMSTMLAAVQACAGALGISVETLKAIQFNSSSQVLTVETGGVLDTAGDNVLAPCTVLFGCVPRDGTVDIIMGGTGALNNSPLILRVTSGKLRAYCGTAVSGQKFSTGSASWATGVAHLGAMTWDGTDITLYQDGAVDTLSATSTRSSSSQNHTGKLFFNDNGDNDVWAPAYIRGVLTLSQINALQAKIASGDLTGAASDINGYSATDGCLVGPTANDDTTVVAGVTEWCAARTTVCQGSPALIAVPA